ncbi:MAG: YCF48-related protein [Kofleriaceae bacterium]
MRDLAIFVFGVLAVTTTGCKKKGTDGGGGGGWFVGESGLMVNVDPDESPDDFSDYTLGTDQALEAIACRHRAEAWVAGAGGTLLYTNDGGQAWTTQTLPTGADLLSVATQDGGSVFLVGDGVFMTAVPDANGTATWTLLDGGRLLGVAASQGAGTKTVLAIDEDGGVWSYADGALAMRGQVAGATAIAVAPDGQLAIAAGRGLSKSTDGGVTWMALDVDPSIVFEDVRFDRRGDAVAVGSSGAVARIDADGRVLLQRVGTADLKTLHVAPTDDYTGIGYAAGIGGQVWITYDSGWTWDAGPTVGGTVLGVDEIGEGHR